MGAFDLNRPAFLDATDDTSLPGHPLGMAVAPSLMPGMAGLQAPQGPGLLGQIGHSLDIGAQKYAGLPLTGLTEMAGRVTGIKPLEELGRVGTENIENYLKEKEKVRPTQQFGEIHSAGDAGTWAVQQLSEFAPQVVLGVASGGLGGLAGKGLTEAAVESAPSLIPRLTGREAVASAAEAVAANTATKAAATKGLASLAVQKGAIRGAQAGAAAGSVGMETATIYQGQEADKKNPLMALAYGTVAGAIDTAAPNFLMEKYGLWKLMPGMKNLLEESSVLGSKAKIPLMTRLKDFAKTAGVTTGVETMQEGIQTVLERIGSDQKLLSDDSRKNGFWNTVADKGLKSAVDPEAWVDIRESMAAGGLLGMVMGGGASALGHTREGMRQGPADATGADPIVPGAPPVAPGSTPVGPGSPPVGSTPSVITTPPSGITPDPENDIPMNPQGPVVNSGALASALAAGGLTAPTIMPVLSDSAANIQEPATGLQAPSLTPSGATSPEALAAAREKSQAAQWAQAQVAAGNTQYMKMKGEDVYSHTNRIVESYRKSQRQGLGTGDQGAVTPQSGALSTVNSPLSIASPDSPLSLEVPSVAGSSDTVIPSTSPVTTTTGANTVEPALMAGNSDSGSVTPQEENRTTEPIGINFAGQDVANVQSPNGAEVTHHFTSGTERGGGSEYVLTADGMVRRNKGLHANTGGVDAGLHDWMHKILFVEDANPTGMVNASLHIAIGQLYAKFGRSKVNLQVNNGTVNAMVYDGSQWRQATWNDAFSKAMADPNAADNVKAAKNLPLTGRASLAPAVGLNVLEYNTDQQGGVTAIHPGSPVTSVTEVEQQKGGGSEWQKRNQAAAERSADVIQPAGAEITAAPAAPLAAIGPPPANMKPLDLGPLPTVPATVPAPSLPVTNYQSPVTAPKVPASRKQRSFVSDLRSLGGINPASLKAFGDSRTMLTANGGNLALGVLNNKGRGVDDVANTMLSQGWAIPKTETGQADPRGFIEMLSHALGKDPDKKPVHPDDMDTHADSVARKHDVRLAEELKAAKEALGEDADIQAIDDYDLDVHLDGYLDWAVRQNVEGLYSTEEMTTADDYAQYAHNLEETLNGWEQQADAAAGTAAGKLSETVTGETGAGETGRGQDPGQAAGDAAGEEVAAASPQSPVTGSAGPRNILRDNRIKHLTAKAKLSEQEGKELARLKAARVKAHPSATNPFIPTEKEQAALDTLPGLFARSTEERDRTRVALNDWPKGYPTAHKKMLIAKYGGEQQQTPREKIKEFVAAVLGGRTHPNKITLQISTENKREKVKNDTGVDIGVSAEIVIADRVVHVQDDHPNMNISDWELLPDIAESFDNAYLGKEEGDPKTQRLIFVRRDKPNNYVYVAEFAGGKSRGNRLNLITFFKDKPNRVDEYLTNTAQKLKEAFSGAGVSTQPASRPLISASSDDTIAPNSSDVNSRDKAPGSTNTVFTHDAYLKSKAILKAKLAQLNAGIDPELMQAGFMIAGYHIESGARKFTAYAQAMIEDFGEAVRPYLKAFYNGVRDLPGIDHLTGEMDDYDTVRGIDAATIGTDEPAVQDREITTERFTPPSANRAKFHEARMKRIAEKMRTARNDPRELHRLEQVRDKLIKAMPVAAKSATVGKDWKGKDDQPEPTFLKGDRVQNEAGRHGAIDEVSTGRTRSHMLFGNSPVTESYSHSYYVTWDNGVRDYAWDFMPETDTAPKVAPAPVINGKEAINPDTLKNRIAELHSSARKATSASERARKATAIAEHLESAKTYLKTAAGYQAILDDWVAKFPGDAAKLGLVAVDQEQTIGTPAGVPGVETVPGAKATLTTYNGESSVEITFRDGKPSYTVLSKLKEYGFRWSMRQKKWYAKGTDERVAFARALEEKVAPAVLAQNEVTTSPDATYVYGKDDKGDWYYRLKNGTPGRGNRVLPAAELKAELEQIYGEKNKGQVQSKRAEVIPTPPAHNDNATDADPDISKMTEEEQSALKGATIRFMTPKDGQAVNGYIYEAILNVQSDDPHVYAMISGRGKTKTDALQQALRDLRQKHRILFSSEIEVKARKRLADGLNASRDGVSVFPEFSQGEWHVLVDFNDTVKGRIRISDEQTFKTLRSASYHARNILFGRTAAQEKEGRSFTAKSKDTAPVVQDETVDSSLASPVQSAKVVNEEAHNKDKGGDHGPVRDGGNESAEKVQTAGIPGVGGGQGAGTVRDGHRRGLRDSGAGDVQRDGEHSGQERPAVSGETGNVAQQRPRNDHGRPDRDDQAAVGIDYRITDADRIGEGGAKQKARDNLAAIRIVRACIAESRAATPQEQTQLTKYVGWGASELANGLFPAKEYNHFTRRFDEKFKPEWEALGLELRDLLSAEEYEGAKGSTLNAHYTSPGIISQMWRAVERFGFTGGRVLEPGAGISLFVGLAPDTVKGSSRFTTVELDPISASIAKLLYPQQDARHQDFTKFDMPNGFYDLGIGNPPFAQTVIQADPAYAKHRFSLHDYFFAKALDKVRPGGILMFVTSRYTMDKQDDKARQYLMKQADLMGAIRLPQTAFQKNAGTEVVTDVLFLRKRLTGEVPSGEAWGQSKALSVGEHSYAVNEYYHAHPEMVLGAHSSQGSMRSANEYTVTPSGKLLEEEFAAAVDLLPEKVYQKPEVKSAATQSNAIDETAPGTLKQGSYYLGKDGEIFTKEGDIGVPTTKKMGLDVIRSFITLRDAAKQVLHVQLKEGSASELKGAQWELKQQYDQFVKKHGLLNKYSTQNRTDKKSGEPTEIRIMQNWNKFNDDPDSSLVMALEKYDPETEEVKLSDIFTQRMINPVAKPRIESVADALHVVLHETGIVDMTRIAGLMGISETTAADSLGELVYLDPTTQGWQTDDEYLSGPVKDKLAAARQAAGFSPVYQRNVAALEAVQPKDIEPSRIKIALGSPVVDPLWIEQFSEEVIAMGVRISHTPQTGGWSVAALSGYQAAGATVDFGTGRRSAAVLLDAALNKSPVQVYDTIMEDGKERRVINNDETNSANAKLEKIKERFSSWLWEDSKRGVEAAKRFNDAYNTHVKREYGGKHIAAMTFPGVSAAKPPYDHQKRVAWRVVQRGNTYMAHSVGAGKTIASVLAGMELKRLGIKKKPLWVVPNHMLQQFAAEFLELYPAAKIMVADEANFSGDNRERFMGRVAADNWDGIIITHSAFKKIPMSPEFQQGYIEEMIGEIADIIAWSDKREDRIKIKDLERKKAALEQRLAKTMSSVGQGKGVSFEESGIDQIFVDEAHEYRKLDFASNQGNLKGIDTSGSDKAFDLFMKSQYLEGLYPGRSMVLMSGTPITNTIGEIFTLQRFLQYPLLKKLGLHVFDAWASEFGDTVTRLEKDPAGAYKPVTRFGKFRNMVNLQQMVSDVMDFVHAKNLEYVIRPEIAGGARQFVMSNESPQQKRFRQGLARRIEAIRNRKGPPSKGDDILLSVITDGRHAALADEYAGGETAEGSKLWQAADKIYGIWKEHRTEQLTQMVFMDMGVPSSVERRGFSSYSWLKERLITLGMPADEIAFMQDYKKSTEKQKLFAAMNSGKMRVLIGSSQAMGTGVNAQRRLVALHHMDPDSYLPSWIEQREGRIVRQGNYNGTGFEGVTRKPVQLLTYVTKGSFDESMWQFLESKQRFIDGFLSGGAIADEVSDVNGAADDFEVAKAMSSDNPLIMEIAGANADLERLQSLRRAHTDDQVRLERDRINAQFWLDSSAGKLADAEAAAGLRQDVSGDQFALSLNGKSFDERAAAGQALLNLLQGWTGRQENVAAAQIGKLAGYRIEAGHSFTEESEVGSYKVPALSRVSLVLVAPTAESNILSLTKAELGEVSPLSLVMRLVNRADDFQKDAAEIKAHRTKDEKTVRDATARLGQPFALAEQLAEKQQRVREMEQELRKQGEDKPDIRYDLNVTRENAVSHAIDRAIARERGEEVPEEGAEQAPTFSRATKTAPAEGRQLSREEIDAYARQLIGSGVKRPYLQTVQHVSELPFKAPHDAKGARLGRVIFLVADNLTDAADVRDATIHEAIGHYGLTGFFGREIWAQLQAIHDRNPLVRDYAAQWLKNNQDVVKAQNLSQDEAHYIAIEEAMAQLSQQNKPYSYALSLVRKIQELFRKIGMDGLADKLESRFNAQALQALKNAGLYIKTGQKLSDGMIEPLFPRFMTAWHGSPHTFDQFRSANIGTGEGAQAYGYGHYFAGSRDVAEWYRDKLSQGTLMLGGRDINMFSAMIYIKGAIKDKFPRMTNDYASDIAGEIIDHIMEGESLEELRDFVETSGDSSKARVSAINVGVLVAQDISWTPPSGRLYQVVLAPKEDEYLSWDKPLNEQSEKVRSAIKRNVSTDPESMLWREWVASFNGRGTGKEFYQEMSGADNDSTPEGIGAQSASAFLHSLGIRGIKYLDGSSRSAGEGNYNYVVFHEDDVSVSARFSRLSDGLNDRYRQTVDAITNLPDGAITANLKQFFNPLDWSRFATRFEEALVPPALARSIAYLLRTPVHEAQKDSRKSSFVETAIQRETDNMDVKLRVLDYSGPGAHQGFMARIKGWATSWGDNDPRTAWGVLQNRFLALDKGQRAAFDMLNVEGDINSRSYSTLVRANQNPRIRAAGVAAETFTLYQDVRRHMDQHVPAVRNQLFAQAYLEGAMQISGIAEGIASLDETGKAQLDEALREWTQQGTIYDERPDHIAANVWTVYAQLRDIVKPRYIKSIADARKRDAELTGWLHRFHGEGEWATKAYMVIDRLTFDVKEHSNGLQAVLPYFPGQRLAGELAALAGNLSRQDPDFNYLRLANGKTLATGPSEMVERFVNQAQGLEIDNPETGQPDRVLTYVRYVTLERQAKKLKEKIAADLKGSMPSGYVAGMTYETKHVRTTGLTEEMYGDINDRALEAAQREAMKKALTKGELSKEEYEKLLDQIIWDTAEVVLGRAAGKYQIRRADYLIEGYDRADTFSLFGDYQSAMAGQFSKMLYSMRQTANFRNADRETQVWAYRYINDSLRNMGAADRASGTARSIATFMYLGFKPASVLVNGTQVWTLGIAELGRKVKNPVKRMFAAQRDVLRDNLSRDEQEMFNSAVWHVQEMETAVGEMAGLTQGARGHAAKTWQQIVSKALAPFQEMEMLNRKTTILAAYRAFRDSSLAEGRLDAEAMKRALELNRDVNFEMSKANLPGFARNPYGRTFYALQSFSFNTFNVIYNRATSGEKADMVAILRLVGAIALIGGAAAIPGGDEADKLYRRLFGRDLQLEAQSWMKRHLKEYGTPGEALYAFAWHGVAGVGGINLSNSLRVQVPFLAALVDGESLPEAASGVFGGLAQKVKMAGKNFSRGNVTRGVENLAPEFVAAPMRAYRQATEGATTTGGRPIFGPDGRPQKFTPMEAVTRAMGFQPLEKSEQSAQEQVRREIVKDWGEQRNELLDSLRVAAAHGSRGDVMRKIMKWNRDVRESQAWPQVKVIKIDTVHRALTSKPDKSKVEWYRQQAE